MKSLLDFLKSEPKKQSKQKIEQIEGIDFKFQKNPLSKSVRILLKTDKTVLVTLPKRTSFDFARKFVMGNLDDIKKSLLEIKPAKYFLDGIEYATKNEFVSILRKKAREYLPKRLEELAIKYGYKYKKVTLKLMKTRWGSCSFYNNISLNIYLMTLEKDLIDYVLVHELVHTVEKNHGNGFYTRLLSHMPDAKIHQSALKSRKVI